MSSAVLERQSWLDGLRASHGLGAAELTLPPSRQEDWRFTDLAPLLQLDPCGLKPCGSASSAAWPEPQADVVRLQLGSDGLSFGLAPGSQPLPDGARLTGVDPGQASGLPCRLHASVPGPQLQLALAANARLRLELWLQPEAAQALLAPRLRFLLAENAELELALRISSSASSLCLPWIEAELSTGAKLVEGQWLQGDEGAVLMAGSSIRQQPGSSYSRTAVVQGWALARQEPQLLQSAGGAETCLRDLAVLNGTAIADLHSLVRFDGPDGRLDQLQKALVDGRSHSIFNGTVQVPRAAQGTDAAQLSRHLLLSEQAWVDTKPELEIVADDVRCSHGATVSSLADEELFYLRSRGIDRPAATELLRRGFCLEVLNQLPPLAAGWHPWQGSSAR